MVDQAQSRIQGAMTSLVDELDRSFLRGMQKSMHLCASKCCDNQEASVDSVHRCIENCSTPLIQAQKFIQNELSQFQERLQRCVMVCQDKVKDKVTATTSESQVSIYKQNLKACAMECVDERISKTMPIRQETYCRRSK
ncbi:UNVERIFIED_CONTAM: hypothetical protein GTU68_036858 [Idotea baltica]|nr:hypothetical protein [Idotea baltica]